MWNGKEGFTLIELLVVVAIIGLLVVIALVAINPVRVIQNSRDSRARVELNQLKASLQLYFNERRSYPAGSGDLQPDYMREVPADTTYVGTSSLGSCTTAGPTFCTSYAASRAINRVTVDDNTAARKCSETEMEIGVAGSYYACPD